MGQRERRRDGWSESDRGEREGRRIKMEMGESEVTHDVKNEAHGDKTFKWEVYNL